MGQSRRRGTAGYGKGLLLGALGGFALGTGTDTVVQNTIDKAHTPAVEIIIASLQQPISSEARSGNESDITGTQLFRSFLQEWDAEWERNERFRINASKTFLEGKRRVDELKPSQDIEGRVKSLINRFGIPAEETFAKGSRLTFDGRILTFVMIESLPFDTTQESLDTREHTDGLEPAAGTFTHSKNIPLISVRGNGNITINTNALGAT